MNKEFLKLYNYFSLILIMLSSTIIILGEKEGEDNIYYPHYYYELDSDNSKFHEIILEKKDIQALVEHSKQPHAYLSIDFIKSLQLLEESLKQKITTLTDSLEIINKAMYENRKVIPYLIAEQAVIDFEELITIYKEKIEPLIYQQIIKGCIAYKEALENGNARISLEEHNGFLTRKTKILCSLLIHEREQVEKEQQKT